MIKGRKWREKERERPTIYSAAFVFCFTEREKERETISTPSSTLDYLFHFCFIAGRK